MPFRNSCDNCVRIYNGMPCNTTYEYEKTAFVLDKKILKLLVISYKLDFIFTKIVSKIYINNSA